MLVAQNLLKKKQPQLFAEVYVDTIRENNISCVKKVDESLVLDDDINYENDTVRKTKNSRNYIPRGNENKNADFAAKNKFVMSADFVKLQN